MPERVPLIPTILVLAAAATMVALGIWQLGRADEKAALIAAYQRALEDDALIEWPQPEAYADALYRRTAVDCRKVRGIDSIGGKSTQGRTGWVHIARCEDERAGLANVTMGWSLGTTPPAWSGGEVTGRVAPYGDTVRLIASEPVAGLEPLARPDPNDLPNNHLAYTGQWFFFAITALVIYFLALKSKGARRSKPKVA
ncbi:MAG: SURF1 family protein [Pseudomonadota bacterium]